MLQNKGKILFISSANPLIGPGTIAFDFIKALESDGYRVDFLTKYKVPNRPDIKFVFDKRRFSLHNLFYRLWLKIRKPKTSGHYLFYRRENQPPVKINSILKKIDDDYQFVFIFFWQELLSYKTVECIYDKLGGKTKFIYLCADYSPMTGGCHFMGNCYKFTTGCGNCPMIGSKKLKDFTYKNMLDRIRINAKVKPVAFMNHYMQSFFEQSPAIQSGVKIQNFTMTLDLDRFKPLDKVIIAKELDLPIDKFIIFFGCQSLSDIRKGMSYLFESLKLFNSRLSKDEHDRILVITAGNVTDEIKSKIPFQQKHFGYVSIDELPKLYSVSNVFLSPTINDAGPSMVNQSIACGTPVISFEIGVALDVIKNQGSGICVPTKDSSAFADALKEIYSLDKSSYLTMRDKCVKTAEKFHSPQAFINAFNQCLII